MNPIVFNENNEKENYWFFNRMAKVLTEMFQDLVFELSQGEKQRLVSAEDYEAGYNQATRDIINCAQAVCRELKEMLSVEELGETGEDGVGDSRGETSKR